MLDNATLGLLTKLKVLAKREGVNIDLIQMSEDNGYAALTLKNLSNSDDTDLVQIVITLMNQFGMIRAPSAETRVDEKVEEKSEADRYIGRLR